MSGGDVGGAVGVPGVGAGDVGGAVVGGVTGVGVIGCDVEETIAEQPKTNTDTVHDPRQLFAMNRSNSSVFRFSRVATDGKTFLVCGLAFSIGWANVLSLELYKAFGTMLTGNLVQLGWSLGLGRWYDTLFYVAVIVSYLSGQFFHRLVSSQRNPWAVTRSHSSLLMALAVLLLGVTQDVWMYYDNGKNRYAVMLLSATLGIVASVADNVNGIIVNLMTGHLTKIANAGFDALLLPDGAENKTKKIAARSLLVVSVFFLGCLWGTALSYHILRLGGHDNDDDNPSSPSSSRFVPAFTPLGALFAIMLCVHDQQVKKGVVKRISSFKRRVSSMSLTMNNSGRDSLDFSTNGFTERSTTDEYLAGNGITTGRSDRLVRRISFPGLDLDISDSSQGDDDCEEHLDLDLPEDSNHGQDEENQNRRK